MRPDLEADAEPIPETLEFCCPRCGYTILSATTRTELDGEIEIDPQLRRVRIPTGWMVETTSLKIVEAYEVRSDLLV